MKISLSPQRRDDALTVSKAGDVLTINGEEFDFSKVLDGSTLPKTAITSDWIASDVHRVDGDLHVSLILPHGPAPSQAVAYPAPITVTQDGPITLPSDQEAAQ